MNACVICDHTTEPTRQTCDPCLARTRSALMETIELYALLPDELEGRAGAAAPLEPTGRHSQDMPMPGGDVLVMLAHGSTMWREQTDVDSVAGMLDRWANDWREHLGITVKLRLQDVTTSSSFLLRAIDPMAQQHPAFAEFASDMRHLCDRLRHGTSSIEPIDRGVPCPYCRNRIVRRYLDRDLCPHMTPARRQLIAVATYPQWKISPTEFAAARVCGRCDQGGRRDDWVCSNRDCGRTFDERRYNLAVWDNWQRLHDEHAATG